MSCFVDFFLLFKMSKANTYLFLFCSSFLVASQWLLAFSSKASSYRKHLSSMRLKMKTYLLCSVFYGLVFGIIWNLRKVDGWIGQKCPRPFRNGCRTKFLYLSESKSEFTVKNPFIYDWRTCPLYCRIPKRKRPISRVLLNRFR
jgi:hypothetical protein